MKAMEFARALANARTGVVLLGTSIALAATSLHQLVGTPASFLALLIGVACRRHVAADLFEGYRLVSPGCSLEEMMTLQPWLHSCKAMSRARAALRSEEHTSELQSLMRISYAVFCLKKKKIQNKTKSSDD